MRRVSTRRGQGGGRDGSVKVNQQRGGDRVVTGPEAGDGDQGDDARNV